MSGVGGSDQTAGFVAALTDAGAGAPFQHDGYGFRLVPGPVVQAYAAARFARVPAGRVLKDMVTAWTGEALWNECAGDAGWLFHLIGRAWAARLGELERQVRGLDRRAA